MKTIRPQPRFRAAPIAAPTASSHAVPQIQLPTGRGPEIVWGSVALRPQISRKNRDLLKSLKKGSPYILYLLKVARPGTTCILCCWVAIWGQTKVLLLPVISVAPPPHHQIFHYASKWTSWLSGLNVGTKALPKIGERAVAWNRKIDISTMVVLSCFRFSFIVGMSTSG